MKKVTIITATYNSESELSETYESIAKQTYPHWEWIVTDDCSTDRTIELLAEIASMDQRVSIIHNSENRGAAYSRNQSLHAATGDMIAFIDSDDIWLPKKLETQIAFMDNLNIDFSFTAYEIIDSQGTRLGKVVDNRLSDPLSYEDMLRKKATLGCSTVMLRRVAFKDKEITMPPLRTGQDYATWLSLLKTGKFAYPLNSALTQYRIRPNSISRNKFNKAKRQWQIYREMENLPLLKSFICFFFYGWRAVFRK